MFKIVLSSREKWFPGTKSQIADRKIADRLYGKSYENFQSAAPAAETRFIDASRRQLQPVVLCNKKLGYKIIF